jgi:alpha-beta hydrolase superfamily lysophospholipase
MSNPGAVMLDTFTFDANRDRASIFARTWTFSSISRPRAVIQITHGMSEHSGRYDGFGRFLAAQGYAVFGIDLRGHGMTAGAEKLGQAGPTAWSDMLADIQQLSDIARARYPDVPQIAFGHSMGSLLVQSQIQNHGARLAGAILCGTMGAAPGLDGVQFDTVLEGIQALALGAQAEHPSQFLGQLVAQMNAPFVANLANATGSEWQTRDPEEIRAFQTDPLCGQAFSNSMTHSVLKGFQDLWVPTQEARIPADLPLLFIAGMDDPVSDRTRTIRELIARYLRNGHRALDCRFYRGGRHEILNEPERSRVHRDVKNWLSLVLE